MAYGDYGAFVYENGVRREDKEDAIIFEEMKRGLFVDISHGVMGDGDIRVKCYKQYNPDIFERKPDGTIEKISYCDEDDEDFDPFEFNYDFEYKGYKFHFESGEPCSAEMIEPDGTKWECTYDYGYGAGWTD